MPKHKQNLKSRKVSLRTRMAQTRKHIAHTNFHSRKERIHQAAIAGAILLEQVLALRRVGAVETPLRTAEGEHDPLDQVLDFDQALVVLHNTAERAADPAPLHRQIDSQARNVIASGCIMKYSVRALINVFMVLALSYYSSFPIHAAPGETSLFDVAASHLSMAGTVTSFASLPSSGILTYCSATSKLAGYTVRRHNATTGRFPNTPGLAERQKLNYLEYDPTYATPAALARVVGIGAGVALDMATGKPVELVKAGRALFTASLADTVGNVGSRVGLSTANALKKATSVL